jgi:signal transduction histidine kinase
MTRAPIRIRAFMLGTFVALLLLPVLAGGAGWLIEGRHQDTITEHQVGPAVAYLKAHRSSVKEPATIQGLTSLLKRHDLLAQLVVVSTMPPAKDLIYLSPGLDQGQTKRAKADLSGKPGPASTDDSHQVIAVGTPNAPAALVVDLYYRPQSRATRALVALVSGIVVLLAGLAVAVWLAGRWMVAPLARLSTQVDNVAGGDLTVTVPRSRIGEVANIAQAVEGMTAALGETAKRRAEADEARRFLVTSIAHDLRTPLFALRGHLQAIRSSVGDPAVHLERAEARADALERLIGNLFAYTRDDYAQPALQLESVAVADLLAEVVASLEHTTRMRDNSFELHGNHALVVVDRDRVKRALTNVLDNALRHSPAGAPIHLSWRADRSTVQLTVRDHGPGIDDELLPHIFEPGIRGNPAPDSADNGAGLGLTIAKRLLEHQSAILSIRNEPTGGAVVTVTLQRAGGG